MNIDVADEPAVSNFEVGKLMSEDGGSRFLRKDGTYVPNYTASHTRLK
jgi:hypothetical protein